MIRAGAVARVAAAGLLLGCLPPALALSGVVHDAETGQPIIAAEVCYDLPGQQGFCAPTDLRGAFELPQSRIDRIRITAAGYHSRTLPAVAQPGPIRLDPAGALGVRLTDDTTGKPLAQGEVTLISTTGGRLGPFPASAGGLEIATLPVGEFRLTARAEGYVQLRRVLVRIEPRKTAKAEIRLGPAPGSKPSKP